MAGNRRQRQLARAKYERQSARRVDTAHRRRRQQQVVAAVVVVALVIAAGGWVVLSRMSGSEASAATEDLPTSSALATPSDAASLLAATGLDCREPGSPRADNVTYGSAPPSDAASGKATSITLTTNCGDIVIALDHDAPKTVGSEFFLAKNGFYDGTSCHRLTTEGIYVLQCGDPKGDGTGGPGYTVPDENLPTNGADGTASYPAGTVAMANAGPDTGGSQFFLVYQDTALPGDYTVWGTVTSGLDIIQKVASAGTADGSGDGTPLQSVFIESASIQTS